MKIRLHSINAEALISICVWQDLPTNSSRKHFLKEIFAAGLRSTVHTATLAHSHRDPEVPQYNSFARSYIYRPRATKLRRLFKGWEVQRRRAACQAGFVELKRTLWWNKTPDGTLTLGGDVLTTRSRQEIAKPSEQLHDLTEADFYGLS